VILKNRKYFSYLTFRMVVRTQGKPAQEIRQHSCLQAAVICSPWRATLLLQKGHKKQRKVLQPYKSSQRKDSHLSQRFKDDKAELSLQILLRVFE